MNYANQIVTSFAASLTLALALTACGDGAPVSHQTRGSVEGSQGAGLVSGSGADDWRQITTLAQSLEDIDLVFDPATRVAKLSFEYLNPEKLSSSGTPRLVSIMAMNGKVGADGKATLTDARLPEYSADLNCEDQECSRSRILISKKTGVFPGTAEINYTVHMKAISFAAFGPVKDSESAQALLSNALQLETDKYQTRLTIKEIIGGRRNLFEIRYDLGEGHATVKGGVGSARPVRIRMTRAEGAHENSFNGTYKADAEYDPGRGAIDIRFIEQDGLMGVSATSSQTR